MDKVFIKNLRVRAIIGVRAWERETPQDLLINVSVFTESRPPDAPDDISICVDYSELAKDIRVHVEKAQRFTVEALAEDIAQLCLGKSRVRKVTVQVEKPGAVTGAEAVGVKIQRGKG